jgi:serine/threonine-protein kinase
VHTYEQVFLAIAVKNKLLTQEDAAACLQEHQGGASAGIEAIVVEKGLLSESQTRMLAVAARRLTGGAAPAPAAAAPAAKPADPREPIPGIRMTGKLGVGGTANVFLADDVQNNRQVAVKIIHPTLARDEKQLRRFQREAGMLIEFEHENIVKGYAQGMMGPLAYFVMEYLEGESGQERLDREKSISEAQSLEIVKEAAKAIDYMQSKGFVHRDIKPGNIMLLKDGRVKVLDLGFAQKIGDAAPAEEETTSGTVQYMSPEQARGQTDIDVRADIYSLGATLYHMIMGETPFKGSDSLEVMAKQVMEALSSSELKNRRISKHMHYFIERMMSKEKDLRYANPRELVDDINEQIEGFRSLEYRPEEGGGHNTSIARTIGGGEAPPGPPTTKRYNLPTTKRIKIDESSTRRFKKK